MLTFLVIARHTPADCALHNEKSAKIMNEYWTKTKELEAKHGVKMVGGWAVTPEHLSISVVEAPSFEAMQAYGMETAIAAMHNWQTVEIKPAITFEELGRMMQQMMRA